MSSEVRNEENLSLSVFPQAVHNLERLHPLNDSVLVALLRDMHLSGHSVVEELGSDDGELLEGGVSNGEHLDLVVVHLGARV